jgi:hypothetical protein
VFVGRRVYLNLYRRGRHEGRLTRTSWVGKPYSGKTRQHIGSGLRYFNGINRTLPRITYSLSRQSKFRF